MRLGDAYFCYQNGLNGYLGVFFNDNCPKLITTSYDKKCVSRYALVGHFLQRDTYSGYS